MSVTVEINAGVIGKVGATTSLFNGDVVDTSNISTPESLTRPGTYQFTSTKTTGIYQVRLYPAGGNANSYFYYGYANFANPVNGVVIVRDTYDAAAETNATSNTASILAAVSGITPANPPLNPFRG